MSLFYCNSEKTITGVRYKHKIARKSPNQDENLVIFLIFILWWKQEKLGDVNLEIWKKNVRIFLISKSQICEI